MIIGNNNNGNKFRNENNNFLNTNDSYENNSFKNKFKQYKENKVSKNNIFVKDIKEQKYSNINSSDEMFNKSLAMLNERLNKGLISLEEFNKQVNLLARKRRK